MKRDADEARDELATETEQVEDTNQDVAEGDKAPGAAVEDTTAETGEAKAAEPEPAGDEAEAAEPGTAQTEADTTESETTQTEADTTEPEPADGEVAEGGQPVEAEQPEKADQSDEPGAAESEDKAAEKAAAKEAKAEAKKAAKKAKAAEKATKPKTKMALERRRQATPLVCCAFLVILSVVALALPMWSIPRGHLLGGGSLVTLTASDYSDGSTSADALKVLKARANDLDDLDISVTDNGDDTFRLRVPESYDASTVADALTRHGKFELVRVDAISDADTLQKINNSASDIELSDGTYEAFIAGDTVTGAEVTETTYYGTTYYMLNVSLNSDGAETLASVTEDLSDSSGQIAVVMDGTILTTPSVSEKIEGGKITIAGSFTKDEAYALAAAINSGELPCSLAQSEPESFSGPFAGHFAAVVGLGALVVAALVTLVACTKFGMGSLVVLEGEILVVLVSMGILTILHRFDLVIMGTFELAGLALAEVSGMLVGLFLVRCYHKRRVEGLSVRKAQQRACEMVLTKSAVACAVCVAAFIVLAIFLRGSMRELFVSAAAADFALLVLIPLYFDPAIRVFTANDATRARLKTDAKAAEDGADASADGE